MFDEEDLPKKTPAEGQMPRVLERLSVDELEAHIVWLRGEITRTEQEIVKKKAASAAASAFFK